MREVFFTNIKIIHKNKNEIHKNNNEIHKNNNEIHKNNINFTKIRVKFTKLGPWVKKNWTYPWFFWILKYFLDMLGKFSNKSREYIYHVIRFNNSKRIVIYTQNFWNGWTGIRLSDSLIKFPVHFILWRIVIYSIVILTLWKKIVFRKTQ